MKKLLVLVLVLSMATIASAALKISVGGIVDPPDSSITLMPSETAEIAIVGSEPASSFDIYLVVQGPGTLSGGTLQYTYGLSAYGLYTADETYVPWMQGVFGDPTIMQVGNVLFADTSDPLHAIQGTILDALMFHCDAFGDVTLSLVTMDSEGAAIQTVWDTQVIHQIPEPITMTLLGLGGLFLRRRK